MKKPWTDPIVEEIRQIRREYSARFGHDLDEIVADLRRGEEDERRKGRPVITLPSTASAEEAVSSVEKGTGNP